MIAVVSAACVVAVVGSLLVLVSRDEAFPTFGRALWWAIVTISTVGYGDVVPSTGGGRVIASGVILFSMAFFPVLTGLVTSALVTRAQRAGRREDAEAADQRQGELLAQLASLESRLERLERQRG